MFDLGFFEEIEDLKYSYAKLKREAKQLAKTQVGRDRRRHALFSVQNFVFFSLP